MAHIVNCLVDPEPASIIRPESPVLPSSLMVRLPQSSLFLLCAYTALPDIFCPLQYGETFSLEDATAFFAWAVPKVPAFPP